MEDLARRMLQITLRGKHYKSRFGTNILANKHKQYSYGEIQLHDNGMRYITRNQGIYDILYEDITGIYMFDYGFTLLLQNVSTKEVTFNHPSACASNESWVIPVGDYHHDIVTFVTELNKRVNVTIITPEDLE